MHKSLYKRALEYSRRGMKVTLSTVIDSKSKDTAGVKKKLHADSNGFVYSGINIVKGEDSVTIYEPLHEKDIEAFSESLSSESGSLVILTILRTADKGGKIKPGIKMYVRSDGSVYGTSHDAEADRALIKKGRDLLMSGISDIFAIDCPDWARIYVLAESIQM